MIPKLEEYKIRLSLWFDGLKSSPRRPLLIGGVVGGVFLLILLVYGGVSYWRWNRLGMGIPWVTGESSLPAKIPTPEAGTPRTFPSPLSGVLRTEEESAVFMARRPLAVMVNNHPDARPQFGLSKADIIYEAVAEGGITRFLAIFHSQNADPIGSIRSARVYYLDWAAEYNAWYVHWGAASMTKGDEKHISDPNYEFECNPAASFRHRNDSVVHLPDLDQALGNLPGGTFWRDNSRKVATEHTGYTSTEKLWEAGPKLYPGWEGFKEFRSWEFQDDRPASAEATAGTPAVGSVISFNFWDMPAFEVRWEYDPATNSYQRYQGGTLQVDAGADSIPLSAKNVVLQFTKESSFNDKKHHLNYRTIGEGSAKILRDGLVIEATWKKGGVFDRTIYYDSNGEEVKFNRGQIWIEIIPDRSAGNVKIS